MKDFPETPALPRSSACSANAYAVRGRKGKSVSCSTNAPALSGRPETCAFPAAGSPNIGREGGSAFGTGVTQIAEWADGTALLATKQIGSGIVIGLNLHVITSDTAYSVIDQAWARQIFLNAAGISAEIPEPSTYALVGAGLLLLGFRLRKSS